jgi:hypothetical protein
MEIPTLAGKPYTRSPACGNSMHIRFLLPSLSKSDKDFGAIFHRASNMGCVGVLSVIFW